MENNRTIWFKYFGDFHDIAFRILLIDDKVGVCENNVQYKSLENVEKDGICVEGCGNNSDKCRKCKMHTVKCLMDDGKNFGNVKANIFDGIGGASSVLFSMLVENATQLNGIGSGGRGYFYWQESGIECYYCPTVIKDFVDDDAIHFSNDPKKYPQRINVYADDNDNNGNNDELDIKCQFAPQIDRKDLKVQIVGVRDVRTALLLLSKFKFDMVFCDYLLDNKDNDSDEREYAKQLLSFLSHDYRDDINNEPDETPKKKRLQVLNQLRHDVLDNRGPLDKLWIMPITGFNQTFIQDLYRNQINLIGHKWNISNGADPITTPWQFLYHLNKFIELQLKSCVYTRDKLTTFLQYSGDDLKNRIKGKVDGFCFEEFQQFMGAEYANFMKRYGARKLIERDAALDGNNSSKSVFATYIAREFYNNPDYSIETELNRKMQSFYHWAATMFNDRYGLQRLRMAFEQLRVFIAYNKLEDVAESPKELLYGLRFLHAVIDSEFNCKKISEWLKYNKE